MGRHEIRLRRKTMTSRRIERHKNYAGLMAQHKKTQRNRTIMRWVLFVLLILISLMIVLFVVERKPKLNTETPTEINTESNRE